MDARTTLADTAASSASSTSALNSSATFFGPTKPEMTIPQDIFNHLARFAFPDTPEGNAELLLQASTNPELASRFQNRLLTILLTHVVSGRKDEAHAMVQKYPGLLLLTGTVKDYSGRTIKGTALRIALGAEDVKCHDQDDDGMVEMLHNCLKQLPNGEAIIAKQTAEQFPEGWEFNAKQRAMRDSDTLNAVINAIAISSNPADWKNAIDTLRSYLAFENKSRPIQTGKHFNHQLLVEAFLLYEKNYNSFGGMRSVKNCAIWCQVIGTIQRYVPAATAQALCTGVGTIMDANGKLQRTLYLHNYHSRQDISYYPLDADPSSLLGLHFAIYSYYAGAGRSDPANWLPVVGQLSKLMSNKDNKLTMFVQPCQQQGPEEAPSRCVII